VPPALPIAIPKATPIAVPSAVPLAKPIPPALPVPTALPVPPALPVGFIPQAHPVDLFTGEIVEAEIPEATPIRPAPIEVASPTHLKCPACATMCLFTDNFCGDCGYYFCAADKAAAFPTATAMPATHAEILLPEGKINDRYELGTLVNERLGVQRFHGKDESAQPVIIIRQPLPPVHATPEPAEPAASSEDEIIPTFDEPDPAGFPQTQILPARPSWPSPGWEKELLKTLELVNLPAVLDSFQHDGYEYLIEELPTGQSLWDAWDDPDVASSVKFGYLVEVAETLRRLHQCGTMLEGLRPDHVIISEGKARLAHLHDLLPLPMTASTPVRGGLYSAPEVMNGQGSADARSELYSFGAMLYSLRVGRELNERTDFDGPGNPKPFIPRFPDEHPLFGRLMMKTFRKEIEARFPTDEASREDSTGFTELIRNLEVLRRNYEHVRLEIASWTTTGMVRTGNEDAYAVLHAAESRQEDFGEAAIIILCDGMGGYEAGEVAAAMTIQSIRQELAQMRPFSVAAGISPFLTDPLTQMSRPEGHTPPEVNIDSVKAAIRTALLNANKLVYQTSRQPGSKKRGMGCTAEVVYIDGRNVIVGHVGDSRTYHLHEGRLVQLTKDQTLVNRLVELGQLRPEEAETHPRRNELQQAIGGQPTVEPGLYHGKMSAGDWVLVCSDGLTNHVNSRDLQTMLQSEAASAEMAARRLVNLTLIEGATDNVTVVVARCPAAQ
jgi:protein phosphatase